MKTIPYTVQQGDSLSLISKKLYGDFSMTDKLAAMNKITNPNLIYPGQQLIVPDVAAGASDAVVVSDSTTNMATSSSSMTWKQKIGKAFPWIIIAAAAGLLYYESQKQKKKNKSKALTGPNTSTESTEKIKEIVKLKEKRNRLPKSSSKRTAIQSEIDALQKEYDLMTA